MSGRIGALNTAGSGWVDPLGVPSCKAMVTVGRDAIAAAVVGSCLRLLNVRRCEFGKELAMLCGRRYIWKRLGGD